MTRSALYLGGGAVVAGIAFYVRRLVVQNRAQTLAAQLQTLPRALAQWAEPIAAGAVATAPGDFPGGLEGWARFGAAIMDRESLGGEGSGYSPAGEWNGTGDGGHAVTPWQLDRRYHARHLDRPDRSPASDSVYAFGLLAERWRRFRSFGGDLALASTAAAYNASAQRVADALAAGADLASIDSLTTGGNYGSDVLRRFGGLS